MDVNDLVKTLGACSTRAAKLLLDQYTDINDLMAAAEAGEVNASEAGSIIASLSEITEDDGVIINLKFSPNLHTEEGCLVNIEWQLRICTDYDLELVQKEENCSIYFKDQKMFDYALANYETISKAITFAILSD